MVLSVFDAPAPPAVRRPVFEVSFGTAAAGEWAPAVVAITIESGLGPGVDTVEILTASAPAAPEATPGDRGTVALGYEDEGGAQVVFTGEVHGIRRGVAGRTVLHACSGGAALARLRVNQSYDRRNAGAIVRDLANLAGVDTGEIDDGDEYPFYVVDDRAGAYAHIASLARKNGYAAYFSPRNALNFGPSPSASPVQTFAYAHDIVLLNAMESPPAAASFTVVGEGAAGSNGTEAWAWVAREPPRATAGSGPARVVSDASLRSAHAVRRAAEAGLTSAAGVTGTLIVPGAPGVTPGSAVEVTDAPDARLDGRCTVRTVRHRYSKTNGFTTTIGFFRGADDGAGLAGVGGAL